MSDKEKCAMNAWLAEHAMDWKRVKTPTAIVAGTFFWNKGDVLIHYQRNELKAFRPTTDRADAMQVMEKCACETTNIEIDFRDGDTFAVGTYRRAGGIKEAEADTLPLAIALFAKALFSKGDYPLATRNIV